VFVVSSMTLVSSVDIITVLSWLVEIALRCFLDSLVMISQEDHRREQGAWCRFVHSSSSSTVLR
jgi:hypothetical protein